MHSCQRSAVLPLGPSTVSPVISFVTVAGSGQGSSALHVAVGPTGAALAGCCFLFGGLSNKVQTFNAVSNQVSNSLLFLAVVALILPSAAAHFPAHFDPADMLSFSRIIAVLLLIVYIAYLYFQLVSHNDLFVAEGGPVEHEEVEEPALTVTAEIVSLLVISLIVAAASECVAASATVVRRVFCGLMALPCMLVLVVCWFVCRAVCTAAMAEIRHRSKAFLVCPSPLHAGFVQHRFGGWRTFVRILIAQGVRAMRMFRV